ncbi:hypothetical protein MRX96_040017 [Rhipicephalus microplus]
MSQCGRRSFTRGKRRRTLCDDRWATSGEKLSNVIPEKKTTTRQQKAPRATKHETDVSTREARTERRQGAQTSVPVNACGERMTEGQYARNRRYRKKHASNRAESCDDEDGRTSRGQCVGTQRRRGGNEEDVPLGGQFSVAPLSCPNFAKSVRGTLSRYAI